MYEKELAGQNDNRILQAATYAASNGNLVQPDPTRTWEIFGEFKQRVKLGSWTVDEMEQSIYKRYGIVEKDPRYESIKDMKYPVNANEFMKLLEQAFGVIPNGKAQNKDEGKYSIGGDSAGTETDAPSQSGN